MAPAPAPDIVIIGIGQHVTGKDPVSSIGLGSCVALILYDRSRKIGSFAHVMLPRSQGPTDRPGKFADTAVDQLIREMLAQGCTTRSIVAKLAGGASMFKGFQGNLNIGERNCEELKRLLKEKGIEIAAEDTGGTSGRTVTLYPDDGRVVVRRADGKMKEI